MLSQRMAKSVCYAVAGIDAVRQSQIADETANRFSAQLDGLQDGSEALGLEAETDPEIRVALSDVADISDALVRSVHQLAAGDLNTHAIQFVIERNVPTLVRINEAVGMIAKANTVGTLDAKTATTINKAGRQRMLSQRISKTVCFVWVGLHVTESLREMKASRETFDVTLTSLRQGDDRAGLLPPSSVAITRQLEIVARQWDALKPMLDQVKIGAQPNEDDLVQIVTGLDVILVEMNRAVKMWSKK